MHSLVSLVYCVSNVMDFTVVVTTYRQIASRTNHESVQTACKRMNTNHADWVTTDWLTDNQLESEQLFN